MSIEEEQVPDSHVPISRKNLSWLAGEDTSFDTIVRVERIRRTHSEAYRALLMAVESDVKRRILASLAHRSGVVITYKTLEKNLPDTSLRTIRKYVSELESEGIVRVGHGKPAAISFPSEAVELLANDILFYVYNEEE